MYNNRQQASPPPILIGSYNPTAASSATPTTTPTPILIGSHNPTAAPSPTNPTDHIQNETVIIPQDNVLLTTPGDVTNSNLSKTVKIITVYTSHDVTNVFLTFFRD
jgi:hypothetical protein